MERIRHLQPTSRAGRGLRDENAKTQVETLTARLDETKGELEAFADLPERIAKHRDVLLSELSRADSERKLAADKLVEAKPRRLHLRTAQT